MKNPKLWGTVAVLVVLAVLLKIFLPFDTKAVQASVAVAPEILFDLGFFQITNTLFTTWIVMIVITVVAFLATRNMSLVPNGLQNVFETLIEAILGLTESVAGPERAPKFFTVAATIFVLVLFANLIGLIPGFGPIGIIHLKPGEEVPQGITILGDAPSFLGPHETNTPILAEPEGQPVLAPLVRAPSTDINLPLALALISVIMTQVYGMQALGVGGYWGKFFNYGKLGKFFGSLFQGKPNFGYLGNGLIDAIVGFFELVSEFAKLLAFTFRLFGNIFAGEVVLLIMSFLFLLLPLAFYALELFVAAVQAFVFFILTVAFMTLATTGHAEAEHH